MKRNSDGQHLCQYQQNEQSPLTLTQKGGNRKCIEHYIVYFICPVLQRGNIPQQIKQGPISITQGSLKDVVNIIKNLIKNYICLQALTTVKI